MGGCERRERVCLSEERHSPHIPLGFHNSYFWWTMKGILKRFPVSDLKRNTFWILLGNGLKLVIQAAYFIIIARSLGPEQYGAFVAVVAIAAILSPFVGLGTSNLIIRNAVRDRTAFSASWGNGLFVTSVTKITSERE